MTWNEKGSVAKIQKADENAVLIAAPDDPAFSLFAHFQGLPRIP